MTNLVTVCALVSLTLVVLVHISVIARWSGKVDTQLNAILKQPGEWSGDLNAMGLSIRADLTTHISGFRAEFNVYANEVQRLRDARHAAEGALQLLKGRVDAYDRIMARLDSFVDHGHDKE